MSFFIDSVNLKEIQSAMELGIFSGVTTNPKLFSKMARSELLDHLAKIANISHGSIYVQVDLRDLAQMERQALTIMEVAPGRIIIKCPMSAQGLELCTSLRKERLPVCLTAVFSPLQAAAAATARAHAVALYTGRISDSGADGISAVSKSSEVISAMGSSTKVLAASIRDENMLIELLKIKGIDITIPSSLVKTLWHHPETDKAISEFKQAADAARALGNDEEDDTALLKMLEDDPV